MAQSSDVAAGCSTPGVGVSLGGATKGSRPADWSLTSPMRGNKTTVGQTTCQSKGMVLHSGTVGLKKESF